ncbi:MAG: oxidoreductase [Dehalococcoidia bacterium]|nr:MAG: oxidoreductase [Dehalococcoidia bacterium]
MQKLTVAVLGTGRMSDIHLNALATLRERGLTVNGRPLALELALYGRDPAKTAALAARYGVSRTSTNLEELIEAPDVDVVANCLVNALHREPLLRAIARGKHVYCEKPLTIELADAERLLAAAEVAGVRHGIVQNMRFSPGPARAKQLIDEGVVGRVFSATVKFGYFVPQTVLNRPTWFYKLEEAGGGIIEDMMAHFFDLFRHLIGPIESVTAMAAIAWEERREPDGTPFRVEVEDIAAVALRFANGAIGNCFASWVRRKHEEVPEFEIDGEAGSLLFSFNRLRVQTVAETPLFTFDARDQQPERETDWRLVPLEPVDPFAAQWESFLHSIVTGEPARPDWQDAVINQRLIKATYLSLRERREVRLEEVPLTAPLALTS